MSIDATTKSQLNHLLEDIRLCSAEDLLSKKYNEFDLAVFDLMKTATARKPIKETEVQALSEFDSQGIEVFNATAMKNNLIHLLKPKNHTIKPILKI
jgi:hypothetical protein